MVFDLLVVSINGSWDSGHNGSWRNNIVNGQPREVPRMGQVQWPGSGFLDRGMARVVWGLVVPEVRLPLTQNCPCCTPQGPEYLPKHTVPLPRLAQASPSSQGSIYLYFLSWFPFKHQRSGSHLLSMETIHSYLGSFPFLSISCESG